MGHHSNRILLLLRGAYRPSSQVACPGSQAARTAIRRPYLATTTGPRLAPGLQILLLGETQFINRWILIVPIAWIPIARRAIVRQTPIVRPTVNIHAVGKIVTTATEITSNASAPKSDSASSRIREAFGNCLLNSNKTCATANGSGSR